MRVAEVAAEATHDLRRRVLRDGRVDARLVFAGDVADSAFHLAVLDDDERVVCVGTFWPEPTPWRPHAVAVRLRGMATDPDRQGQGLGRLLLGEAVGRLRAGGVQVLWANARDPAVGFYEGLGFAVVGEGFVTEIGIPHHVVVLDL